MGLRGEPERLPTDHGVTGTSTTLHSVSPSAGPFAFEPDPGKTRVSVNDALRRPAGGNSGKTEWAASAQDAPSTAPSRWPLRAPVAHRAPRPHLSATPPLPRRAGYRDPPPPIGR